MIRNKKGTTIVSVLIAFALLLVAIAAVYGSVITSQNLLQKSRDSREKSDALIRAYYEGELTGITEEPLKVRVTVRGDSFDMDFTLVTGNRGSSRICYFK